MHVECQHVECQRDEFRATGERPAFDAIVDRLRALEKTINK